MIQLVTEDGVTRHATQTEAVLYERLQQLERSNKELREALDNLLLEKRCECKNCMGAHAALSAADANKGKEND